MLFLKALPTPIVSSVLLWGFFISRLPFPDHSAPLSKRVQQLQQAHGKFIGLGVFLSCRFQALEEYVRFRTIFEHGDIHGILSVCNWV